MMKADGHRTIKRNKVFTTGVPKVEERKKGVESLFKEMMAENFLYPGKNFDNQVHKLIGHPKISIQNSFL